MGQIQELHLLKLAPTESLVNIREQIVRQVEMCQLQTGTESTISNPGDSVSTQAQFLHLNVFNVCNLLI